MKFIMALYAAYHGFSSTLDHVTFPHGVPQFALAASRTTRMYVLAGVSLAQFGLGTSVYWECCQVDFCRWYRF